MTQRRSRRHPPADASTDHRNGNRTQCDLNRIPRQRPSHERADTRTSKQSRLAETNLSQMIERDAPLQTHTLLVLMYGPFQAAMSAGQGQGVASWLQDCVRKHGIPSLVRFDYGRRAQVFRRDQFQPWLEPFLAKIPG